MEALTWPIPNETRGRKPKGQKAITNLQAVHNYRANTKARKLNKIAVIDFETDPFDNSNPHLKIFPFAACIYSDDFDTIIIWESNFDLFIEKLIQSLHDLPDKYMIYAHNGGKFDFMFIMHKLRGNVMFKGRGLMSGEIEGHQLRDSFHLIPERLANFKKDKFDYKKLLKSRREKHKAEIIKYMTNDCIYLLDILKSFLQEYGFKISIGQAAMAVLKQSYKVEKIGESTDDELRKFFFGGRVECIAGKGHFVGDYILIDVNSMYPSAMVNFNHPTGNKYSWRRNGGINSNTGFIELECTNHGALVRRAENNETTANATNGKFFTTIHEYQAALELGLISDIKIHHYVDCNQMNNFSDFILPIYAKREIVKKWLDDNKSLDGTDLFNEKKKESIFLKLLMNNAYGKFAQNPRRFKECFITDAGDLPPAGFEASLLPAIRTTQYDIWERPSPRQTFNNVGTAASITGAARSVLLRAIKNSIEPIYCDTDSLICKGINNTELHPSKLGAWDIEKRFNEVIVAGKKLYACRTYENKKSPCDDDFIKVRSKGSPEGALGWVEMQKLIQGETILVKSNGVTLTKGGKQFYMTRRIKATAPQKASIIVENL